MNWLNLRTEILHSPEFIGCHPTRRATWLSLSLWCASQENGGIVSGGANWSDRQWQQTCGVTKDEATDSCELFRVEGADVELWGYPVEKEAEVQALRQAGKRGGSARTRAKIEAAKANGAKRKPSQTQATLGSEPKQEPKPNPSLNPTEGEGERKENEKKNTISLTPPTAPFALALEMPPQPTKPSDADAIYAAYPRKAGKTDALKAIARTLKAGAITADALLAKVQAYATATKQWPADERRFIPYPASWINAGQFNDDPSNWTRTATNHAKPIASTGTRHTDIASSLKDAHAFSD